MRQDVPADGSVDLDIEILQNWFLVIPFILLLLSVTLFPLLPYFSPLLCLTPTLPACAHGAAHGAVVKPVTFPSLPSLEWTEECPSLPPPAAPNHVSNNQEAVREAPVQGNSLVKPVVKEQQGFFFPENEIPSPSTKAVFPQLVTQQCLCLLI